MRAVDTNVLVRLLARDDARQAAAAENFVVGGAWISHVVLVEAIWVLDSVYGVKPKRIAAAVEMLLDHDSLVIQDADVVTAALAAFRKRPALGFSDCLIVEAARKAGHLPLGTFDGELAKLEGTERLELRMMRAP
jgi:predicted nucleic-acid-binding protein